MAVGSLLAVAISGGFFAYRCGLAPAVAGASYGRVQRILSLRLEKRDCRPPLALRFPQIRPPFPDVWGLGDSLEVVCHLTGPDGEGLAARSLEIRVGNEPAAQLTTDGHGIGRWHYSLEEKGQHEFEVRFKGEDTLKGAIARRGLRIVDYREEIVDLFEALVDCLRGAGIDLAEEATPREIERRVLSASKSIPDGMLDRAVSCFEEANYSLHAMRRKIYQEMYLAQEKIREYGRSPEGG